MVAKTAPKKSAAKAKPSTAVATMPKAALPENYEEAQAADIASFKSRLAVSETNKIQVTQDKFFKVPVQGGDSEKVEEIAGIIVEFAARKNYYSTQFDRDNPIPPDCHAIGFVNHDNLMPQETALNAQCDNCRGCAMNKFEKLPNGKWKAKECKDSYRLALLAPDDDGSGRLMTLDISSTGIKAFDKYVRTLAAVQKAPYNVVTVFSFDPTSEYPSVRFEQGNDVPKQAVGFVLQAREEAAALVSKEPNLEVEEKPAAKPARKLSAPKKPMKKAA